mgnify:CR=1 FL=1
MKVIAAVVCLALIMSTHAKITKSNRTASPPIERQLMDGDADMEVQDTNAITNADSRMVSLVNSVNRLKVKLHRELETTVNYLRYHFNQRDAFDKRIMMQMVAGKAENKRERRLSDQPMLKDYGKIEAHAKAESFDVVKTPEAVQTDASLGKK